MFSSYNCHLLTITDYHITAAMQAPLGVILLKHGRICATLELYRKPVTGSFSAYNGIQKTGHWQLFCIRWYTESLPPAAFLRAMVHIYTNTGCRAVGCALREMQQKETPDKKASPESTEIRPVSPDKIEVALCIGF